MRENRDSEIEAHKTSNRIAAVDITRVIAALSVMYSHLMHAGLSGSTGKAITNFLNVAIGTFSPVFFMLAGYFVCRNISWKKALHNALWCFLPFLLWNVITGVEIYFAVPNEFAKWNNISAFLGISSLTTLGADRVGPINMPLWFMRDLVFLFLISPIVYKWSRYILPCMVVLSISPGLPFYFWHHPFVALSPYSLGFFTLGCFLRTFSKDKQQSLLRFYSPAFIVVFFFVGGLMAIAGQRGVWPAASSWRYWDFLPAILSIWALYQVARCLEVHSPRITRICLKIAPVTFLTFATHWPIYKLVAHTAFRDSVCVGLLLPILIFGANSIFFFALKKWCRPLLHIVAHYKLRPDDFNAHKTHQ